MNKHSRTNNGGNLASGCEMTIAGYLTTKKLLVIFAIIFVCLILFKGINIDDFRMLKHLFSNERTQ